MNKKKFALVISLVALICLGLTLPSFAALEYSTAKDYNASGSTEGSVGTSTGVMKAVAGRSVAIYNIWAKSDLSTSVVKIYDGDTTGATDNYSVVADFDLGDGSELFEASAYPLYVAPVNTQVKVGVTSTTANTVIVNYTYQ
jgi:hypothetical protein